MGHIIHDAIVVTANEGHAKEAQAHAVFLGLKCSPAQEGDSNGYFSFLILPDGSKEGWAKSDEAGKKRQLWEKWAQAQDHSLEWVHVRFGDDFGEPKVVANSESW